MRAPKKVIAAMALATMIGGTVGQAFADDTTDTTGPVNGQPTRRIYTEITDDTTDGSEGNIIINGEFTKFISNLPELDKERNGKYLCVTMPISLDYRYDVDSKTLYSPNNTIIKNESVSVTKEESKEAVIKPQPVSMTFVSMSDTNNEKMEYVKKTSDGNDEKVQLPFQLVVSTNGQFLRNVHLADLTKKEVVDKMTELEISAGNNIEFKIAPIGGQEVKNGNLIKDGEKVSTDLTLKFEYKGQ